MRLTKARWSILSLEVVRALDAKVRTLLSGLVAVFGMHCPTHEVGATSVIGESTVKQCCRQATNPGYTS